MFLHDLTYGLALSPSLQQALAYGDSAITNETFDKNQERDNDDWTEDERDDLIKDSHAKHRDSGIRSVIYFSGVLT